MPNRVSSVPHTWRKTIRMGSVGHGSHRVWRVPALWVQREPALAREESRRIKESDRYRFARSLERFFARPWRVWPLLRSTVVLNPTGLEDWSPRDPVYPSVDHDQLTQAARAHDRDTRAGYIPMWEAVRALSTDAVSRLTDELSGLRWPRRRWCWRRWCWCVLFLAASHSNPVRRPYPHPRLMPGRAPCPAMIYHPGALLALIGLSKCSRSKG